MSAFATYLDNLDSAARAASAAELEHQKAVAARAAELRAERAFAWRRLNLVRSLGAATRAEETEEAAAAAGRAALLRTVGWNGATEVQRDTADRFGLVVLAIWSATRDDTTADPEAALAEFEAWYMSQRGAPFLALMEREIVELPLVEI